MCSPYLPLFQGKQFVKSGAFVAYSMKLFIIKLYRDAITETYKTRCEDRISADMFALYCEISLRGIRHLKGITCEEKT